MKKYELLQNDQIKFCDDSRDITLSRVRYLVDIPLYNVKAGDLGGYLESEHNLSHKDNCVVLNTAWVYDEAIVCEDAYVANDAEVFKKAQIKSKAQITNTPYGVCFFSSLIWIVLGRLAFF